MDYNIEVTWISPGSLNLIYLIKIVPIVIGIIFTPIYAKYKQVHLLVPGASTL